jgi:predicted DNA-binding WGR domain protein
MPRYEFKEGTSSKFWEITLDGSSFTTTYGKIGTDGQTTIKEWDSDDKAKKEYDKLIAEKTKKGYVLTSGNGSLGVPAAAKAAKQDLFEDEGDDEQAEAPKPKATPAAAGAGGKSSKSGDGRYFEFVEGTSSKFWQIHLDGTSFTTRYGKIGTPGQETLKEYDTADKAKKEYDKLVAEKTKKGYVEK